MEKSERYISRAAYRGREVVRGIGRWCRISRQAERPVPRFRAGPWVSDFPTGTGALGVAGGGRFYSGRD